MSTRPRKGSTALSHVSNHSSNNSTGSAKYSERSAMTTISSRNTTRKSGLATTSAGPLSSSPLDSKKQPSVYDEILKTAFKKKKPPVPSSTSTSSALSSTTGSKPKTISSHTTPTKPNVHDKTKETSKTTTSKTIFPPPKPIPHEDTVGKTRMEIADSNNDQQQIPTRDTTNNPTDDHQQPVTTIEASTEQEKPETVGVVEESNHQEDIQEIPTRLEEGKTEIQSIDPHLTKESTVTEKPNIDISKISALIETEKDLLNHSIANNYSKTTIPSTPSERIASLTEEEKIKVKNLAARNLKYNDPEDLFETPKQNGLHVDEIMDDTINISVIQPKDIIKPDSEIGDKEESTPVFTSETTHFSDILHIQETPIVKKETNTSIDSESSYGSYIESDDVVVFESPNKEEREVQKAVSPNSPNRDDVMDPVEMNESFSGTATEKLEAHLQKAMSLEKENQLLEQEIKHLERELQSNQENRELEDMVHVIHPLHINKPQDKNGGTDPYFEESPLQETQQPKQENRQTIEISREELVKPRAFIRHEILFQEVRKELKRHVPEIKPIKIPEVFIQDANKPKSVFRTLVSSQQGYEPENELVDEEYNPEEEQPEEDYNTYQEKPEENYELVDEEYNPEQEPQEETEVIKTQQIAQEPVRTLEKPQPPPVPVALVDEDLEFEKELQKIVGEDFKRKKTNSTLILDSPSIVDRGAASPIARLRRRVQTNVESKNEVSYNAQQVSQEQPISAPAEESNKTSQSQHRLAGYKARRDARMKLLEKQEISITLLSSETPSHQEVQQTAEIVKPAESQHRKVPPLAIQSMKVKNPILMPEAISTSQTPAALEKATTSTVVKEVAGNQPPTVVKEDRGQMRRMSEKKEVVLADEVKMSRKKFDEVIIISPPRNPPPAGHHITPQIDQETVDLIVPEDTEKIVLLKKTEALLNRSRERHGSPNIGRKINLTKETESPNVSFSNVATNSITTLVNNVSTNQSTTNQSIVKEDPRQETLNRVNHLEKFMKDLKKKKQDEIDVFEKKFNEMKSYFSFELGTRDSEIHNLTHQNKLLRDNLSVAQSQIDDLSIVIEHILETQDVLESQLRKKTNLLPSIRDDEPVSPVSHPGNDVQSCVESPVVSGIVYSPNNKDHPQETRSTPLGISKEDINVDLSMDGEFYLSIGKSSLPLGEYVKTLVN